MQYFHNCYSRHWQQHNTHFCEIGDENSKHFLRISIPQGWDCRAYRFQKHHFWEGDEYPDGALLIQRFNPVTSIVCFVELKRSGGKEVWEKARRQLEMAVSHFAPFQHHPFSQKEGLKSHGDVHHARWRESQDHLDVHPAPDHLVLCVVVVKRRSSRSLKYFNPAKPL